MKIGIFGGSFNPPHNGHVNSVITVKRKLGLDKIVIVPNAQNPLKMKTEGPTPEQRLEMTRLAFETYGPGFSVSDFEVKKGGASYTIDTLLEFKNQFPKDELYLVLGLDLFEEISLWKDYQKLFEVAHFVLTTRPGLQIPEKKSDLPNFVQNLILDYQFNILELKTGKRIEFLTLKDVEASSTELRKLLRSGRSVEKFIPLSVESYIKSNALYRNLGHKIGDYQTFTEFCVHELYAKKGLQIRAFDLTKLPSPSEFTVVCSGTSTRHTVSLGEALVQAVKEEYNVYPQSVEGTDTGRWVVVDYGNLIVHVFYDFIRQEYSLEKLWKDGVELHFEDPFESKSKALK